MDIRDYIWVSPRRFLWKGGLAVIATLLMFATFSQVIHPLVGSASLMLVSTGMLAGIEPVSNSPEPTDSG